MVSLDPPSNVKTQETADALAIDSAKENLSGSSKQELSSLTEKYAGEALDEDTTPFSDDASISENDSCSSAEELIKSECNEQTGAEALSESAVTENSLTRNEITCPKESLASKENIPSPSGTGITHISQQNGTVPGHIDGYARALNNVKSEANGAVNASVYRDYSRLPRAEDGNGLVGTSAASGKEPPFPVKLHKILSKAEFADVVSWLPHGRSWRVLKPKAFEEKVVPLYFRHAKYASFMRQVNGWGFKRMTQGPDHNSYYHELFLRGLPHLCLKMRRPARAKPGSADSDINPDFYRLSMVAPLPNPGNPVVKDTGLQGIHELGAIHSNALVNLANLQSSALGLQTHGMPNGGLTNMNFPNLGMNGFNAPNISANALLQQQIQSHFQPRLGNVGQQLGFPPVPNSGGNNALGIVDANNAMNVLRQRREDLVRQLQMIGDGHRNANGSGNAPEQTGLLHNSNLTPSPTNLQSNISLPSSETSNLLATNVGQNSAQLQQIMMSQLQATGMRGSESNIATQQAFGGIGLGSGGMPQLDLNSIPGSVVGGGVGNINPQLLMQHNAVSALGVPGMNNPLMPPGLGNLGFMMQNHMLPNHHGSFQPMNQNPSIIGQGNLQLSNDSVQMKCGSNGNIYGEKKIS